MLTLRSLPLRSLAYHWRGNLAVMLGVVVGTAVLAGALFVGDSLRGSLRAKAEKSEQYDVKDIQKLEVSVVDLSTRVEAGLAATAGA